MSNVDEQAGREQPPEGKLIQSAREERGFTAEYAGRLAGMSGTMQRAYERGWRSKEGRFVRVRASTETLTTMASIVGVTAAQLSLVRPDAAAELMRRHGDGPQELARLLETIREVFGLDVFDSALDLMGDKSRVVPFPGRHSATHAPRPSEAR